jgi:UDP-N-acetylglucosamine 4-epimerase
MYQIPYHSVDLSQYSFLVTGGAGFIGSNIVEYLVKYKAGKIRILDNLSNGYYSNIEEFIGLPNLEFIEGDIRNLETCRKAVSGIDFISHQAALGSVPRSIVDPILSNEVNVSGFLNMLVASKDSKDLKQMVYAASSSTYGDSLIMPKIEGEEGKPLSPYAVTKAVNEMYADVFSNIYGLHTIGLRYFNIFGPKQDPNNAYAAVIPIFCKHFIEGVPPTIYGNGETSRDFTFVENAVQANIRGLLYKIEFKNNGNDQQLKNGKEDLLSDGHQVFNVACGDQISLNEIIKILEDYTSKNIGCVYGPEREGDVKHSKASIDKIQIALSYEPNIKFREGIETVYKWYEMNTLK